MNIHSGLFFVLLFIACASGHAQAAEIDMAEVFENFGVRGAVAVYDPASDRWFRSDAEACRTGAPPASTFKIVHTLIGLGTGVVDREHVFIWNGTVTPVASWNQNQNLETAFKRSAIWCYEEIGRDIGPERMRRHLGRMGYGNRKNTGTWPFWLKGDLRISPDEQIGILRRLHNRTLPYCEQDQEFVEHLMFMKEEGGVKWYSKTGWTSQDGISYGRLAGFVVKNGNPVFFSTLLMSSAPGRNFGVARFKITEKALQLSGVLE